MKTTLSLISVLFAVLILSCGKGNAVTDQNLSPREKDAVKYVEDHLEKNDKLLEVEVVNGPMPVALMSDELKRYRDDVNKAGNDYNSCKTRNLEKGMISASEKLFEIQTQIKAKISEFEAAQGTSSYLFVLSTVETPTGIKKLISVFNPETPQHDFTMVLTKPIVNNALMIMSATSDNLFDYAVNQQSYIDNLKNNNTDSIISFILNADPSEVK